MAFMLFSLIVAAQLFCDAYAPQCVDEIFHNKWVKGSGDVFNLCNEGVRCYSMICEYVGQPFAFFKGCTATESYCSNDNRDSTLKKQCSSLHNNAFNESDYGVNCSICDAHNCNTYLLFGAQPPMNYNNHYHDNFDQYNHDDNSHYHDDSDNHDNNYRKTTLVRLGHPWM
ncbi:hypothetical protein niasHT_018283 [Heterodera trifolii]|uniref:Uncharacterized protein n=1 Tax=Heterodera trifolii TaxID=157864 RepID=A0ABD2L8P6_9BILA